jgi:glycosyltransferase involved in cell wall biosynthesis
MRIVLDCERMRYPCTGIFEYCAQLGNALNDIKDETVELSYYVNEEAKKYFGKGSHFLIHKRLHKFIFPVLKDIDLWHTTYQMSAYTPNRKKVKSVLTVHDLNFLYEEHTAAEVKKKLDKHQKRITNADHIVAISNFVKNDIIQHLDIGNKPITVIYNGCVEPQAVSINRPLSKSASPFLFTLGTVNAKKNAHVLIPLLIGNDFELVIAGKPDTTYPEKIRKEAEKYGVAQRVKILGGVTEADKQWYYKNCEAFLFPSLAEGFGIPPIEAMRSGKPTFLSDRTSLPEIGGKHAYYFKSFDPAEMQSVFNAGMDHFRQHQPAPDIILHAQQFNWKNTARAYLDVYKRTLNG